VGEAGTPGAIRSIGDGHTPQDGGTPELIKFAAQKRQRREKRCGRAVAKFNPGPGRRTARAIQTVVRPKPNVEIGLTAPLGCLMAGNSSACCANDPQRLSSAASDQADRASSSHQGYAGIVQGPASPRCWAEHRVRISDPGDMVSLDLQAASGGVGGGSAQDPVSTTICSIPIRL